MTEAVAHSGALHRVARAVASGAPSDEVFAIAAREVAGLFGVDAGVVLRFAGDDAVVVGSYGDHATPVGFRAPVEGDGAVPRVRATGVAARASFDEIPADDPARVRAAHGGYRTGVAAPVRAAGRLWGVVLAAATAPHALPRDAEDRLSRFADLVALAVANAEDRRRVARRIAGQSALRRVATAIAAGSEPGDVMALICEEAARLTGCAHAAVVRREGEDGGGEVVARWGDEDAAGAGLTAAVAIAGRPWGALMVQGPEGDLGPDDSEVLDDLADLARLALADADQRRRISEYAAEQAGLRRAATLASSDAEPEAVLEAVCREAAQLLDLPAASVVRLGVGRHSEVVAGWRRDGGPPAEPRGGMVSAPIVMGEDVWGLLVASADGGSPPPAPAGGRLAALAELAGIAIATSEARRRSVEDAAAAIAAGGLDMDATLGAIIAAARRALDADRATIVVLPDGQGELMLASTDPDPAVQGVLDAAAGADARHMIDAILDAPERIVVREEPASAAELRLGSAARLRSYIAARLEHPSVGALGVLVVSFRSPRRFTARQRAAVRSLMAIADLALANARLHARTLASLAEAEERAATDPLTGLANHRAFHEGLRDEVARARRHRRPLALALIDLDHFKDVNDRHGHQVGDEVLRETAARLLQRSRPEDLVARIGGEEFAWLLPESDALDAWKAAERAREAVAAHDLAPDIRCTVSIGIAELAQAQDAGDLVRLADGALYWAKGNGRNVSFCYSPEVVEVLSAEERAQSLERSQALNAIRALARAVDARDPSTRRHSERVAHLAVRLAGELGWTADRQALLRDAALVHDVGKIGVPDSILFKPARLTDAEHEHVKEHATLGAQIVGDVLSSEQVSWVRSLHERMDGRGYPEGLPGAAIPDGARILAVADAWDAMTSARPYTPPLSRAQATAECRREAGRQFCPDAVAALERLTAGGRLPSETD